MAFKPNYKHERATRDRAKEQKKQEKLKKREETAARQQTTGDEGSSPSLGQAETNVTE